MALRAFPRVGPVLAAAVLLMPSACIPVGSTDPAAHRVRTGADILVESGMTMLRGRRVGLVANQTSRVGRRPLADLLAEADDVRLTAIFGPEHGFRGNVDDGWNVGDAVDSSGTPVYSLYGERTSPPRGVLDSLDVLLFDIQDVGARFYTFISTMGLSMQAAAAAGVEFVVLDRPNPLGGVLVDGYVLEPEHASFVGMYPIPVQHGLTIGELAGMIVGEGWVPGLDNLRLTVIRAEGWTRSMLWPETGIPWIATSPNIPDFETALVYPGTCFFEGTTASEGRGTDHPFLLLGAPWLDAEAAEERLRASGTAGLRFEAARFTPRSLPGRATTPRFQDREIPGIRIVVEDARAARPLAAGILVLAAFASDPSRPDDFMRRAGVARLAGTERLRDAILRGSPPDSIVASWGEEVARFEALRRPYLLYD